MGGLRAAFARSDDCAFLSAPDANAAALLLSDPEPGLASAADLDNYPVLCSKHTCRERGIW